MCSYFTRLFDRFASVAIQASTCPYSMESVISFVASEYGCSKESVDTIINASVTGKEEDDP